MFFLESKLLWLPAIQCIGWAPHSFYIGRWWFNGQVWQRDRATGKIRETHW